MKKFSLLLCLCLATLMVPQRALATPEISYNSSTKVLTINSSTPGELTRSMVDAYKADVEKIVLIGSFNGSDLEEIKANKDNDHGFEKVTSVNMALANIYKTYASSNEYYLRSTAPFTSTPSEGARGIVGGTYQQATVTESKSWSSVSQADGLAYSGDFEPVSFSESQIGEEWTKTSYEHDDYIRFPATSHYYQMAFSNPVWTKLDSDPGAVSFQNVSFSETTADLTNPSNLNYPDGSYIRFVTGGTFFQLTGTKSWETASITVTSKPSDVAQLTNVSYTDAEKDEHFAENNEGAYISIPVSPEEFEYYKVMANGESFAVESATESDYNTYYANSIQNNYYPSSYDNYTINYKWETVNNYIRVKKCLYYKLTVTDKDWTSASSSDAVASGKLTYPTFTEAERDSYKGEYQLGDYIGFDVTYNYYQMNHTKTWNGPLDDIGGNSAILITDFTESECNDHKAGYADGQYIQFPQTYNYYKMVVTTNIAWSDPIDYSSWEGPYTVHHLYSDDAERVGDNTVANGERAVTGGTQYMYKSNWTTDLTLEYDYSQMKFSYWSETLTTAVTSKYADTSISNEVFDGCTKLTSVDYMAGNVTGFGDHKISDGYNTTDNSTLSGDGLSVKIYKDVTQIDDAAFERCDVLTSVTFVNDYVLDGNHTQTGYPKELTIGNSAFEGCANLSGIVIPNRVTSIGNSAFKMAGNRGVTDEQAEADDYEPSTEFKVTFERRNHLDADGDHPVAIDCDFPLTIGNSAFEQCYNLKSLSLPIRLETMGLSAFKNTKGLTTLVMRETTKSPYTPTGDHHLLKTIPDGAFSGSNVKEVIIPKSVTLIENNAFGSTNSLGKVTFQEQATSPQEPLIIKSGAFTGGDENIIPHLHVYVNINPANRKIVCEYNAFNFTQMMGQTSTTNEHRGTLHFNEEDWDYYQGDWKKGLAFRQDNLNAFKDGYTGTYEKVVNEETAAKITISLIGLASEENRANDTDFEANAVKGKYTRGTESNEEYAPANGWQQFASTSTGVDVIIPGGRFIRTYSTSKKYEIPKTMINLVETDLVKVYRVTNFSDGYVIDPETGKGPDVNSASAAAEASRSATAQLVINTSTQKPCYIPKNTGLIMVGNVEENSSYLTYFKERATDVNEPEYPYHQESDASTNLLAPTTGESITSVVVNPTEPYPIWSSSTDANANYRIFGMAKADYSDIGVTQYQFARMKPNQTMPENRAYLKLPVSMYHWARERMSTGPTYNDEPSSSRSISLLFSDEDNELTGIETSAMNSSSAEGYYTIQGVRVVRPEGKGLFIKNGKKIIVK